MVEAKKKLAEIVEKKLCICGSYDKLAEDTGISKTTLFRIAKSDWNRPGRAIREAAEKFDVRLESKVKATECKPVLKVIDNIWDGTEAHGRALAKVLEQLPLIANSMLSHS